MHARRERNQNRGNTQVESHLAGVHRSAAAESDQREVADIVASCRGDRFDRFLHFDIDDLQHPSAASSKSSLSGLAMFSWSSFFRLSLVELHSAAEEMIRVQNAGNDIGIGDRGVLAAAVVANRARVGAGAIGTDLQPSDRVDARDRAAARADGMDVEHRQRDRPQVDFSLGGDHRIALMDQRDVAASATHIESDDVVDADPLASAHGRNDAAGWTGEDGGHRLLSRPFERRYTAVGLHDVELRCRNTHLAHAVFQTVQVTCHHRLDIGVDDRGAQPIKLANLRQDFIG